MRQAGEREGEARVVAVGVVDEDRVLADVGHLDDAQLAVGAHDAHPCWPSAPNRIGWPWTEVDHHLVADLAGW